MDKIQARQKIKKHLKRQGHRDDFEITHHLVFHWWHVLNKAVFDGKLKTPKNVILRNFRDESLGWCMAGKNDPSVILGLRRELYNRKTFLTVLVHEMVHAYEHQVHGKMSHRETFYMWKEAIYENTGLTLDEWVEVDY